MAEYEEDSFEDLPEEDSMEASEQHPRRSSSILSPKPKSILEDDYEEDDYVQDDDDDESWDEAAESANNLSLRPQPTLGSRPQSAVINGGRPESASSGSRPQSASRPPPTTATLPSHTERIVIEPSNTSNYSAEPTKQATTAKKPPKLKVWENVEHVLETKWQLPPQPKTPRLRFRGDDTLEWPPGPRAGRRKVPCRPASASDEVDYAEAIRARAALDVVIGRLREKTKASVGEVVAVWRDKHNQLEAIVKATIEKIEQKQDDEIKRERNNLKHKIIPQNTNKISKKVIDLMSLAASHAVASGRATRTAVSLEKQRDYKGGLLITRENYVKAVYHDEKRKAFERKVVEANCHVDKSKVLSKKMSKNFAVDVLSQRHAREISVIAKKAEAEQNRLMVCRNKSLQLLNFHAQNTEEILTHAELLERNLRNSATSLGSAGLAAEMARTRSDRSIKDLQRHCQEAKKLALNFKLEFHVPLPHFSEVKIAAENNEEEMEEGNRVLETIDTEAGTCARADDATAPASHTMAEDLLSHGSDKEEADSQHDTALRVKKTRMKGRTRKWRRKSSKVQPAPYTCTWCGGGVLDVSRLVFMPLVGGPIGATPAHYCTWSCAKSWNLKYSPVMHKHTRDVLIDLEAGKLIPESRFRESQMKQKEMK